MATLLSLDLARLHLRREMQILARAYPNTGISAPADGAAMELVQHAVAYEQISELIGKHKLLSLLCDLAQHHPGDCPHVREVMISAAAIGVPHPLVLNFEASSARGVPPEGCSNDAAIGQIGGERLRNG